MKLAYQTPNAFLFFLNAKADLLTQSNDDQNTNPEPPDDTVEDDF